MRRGTILTSTKWKIIEDIYFIHRDKSIVYRSQKRIFLNHVTCSVPKLICIICIFIHWRLKAVFKKKITGSKMIHLIVSGKAMILTPTIGSQ